MFDYTTLPVSEVCYTGAFLIFLWLVSLVVRNYLEMKGEEDLIISGEKNGKSYIQIVKKGDYYKNPIPGTTVVGE